MTGFEPRTSGIGSNRSTNWATTTAHWIILYSSNVAMWRHQLLLLVVVLITLNGPENLLRIIDCEIATYKGRWKNVKSISRISCRRAGAKRSQTIFSTLDNKFDASQIKIHFKTTVDELQNNKLVLTLSSNLL